MTEDECIECPIMIEVESVADKADYMLVIVGIILGLSICRIVAFSSQLVVKHNHTKKYWVHITWLLVIFLLQVQYWYSFWSWYKDPEWTFSFFLIALSFPLVMYMTTTVLTPELNNSELSTNFEKYFYENRKILFVSSSIGLFITQVIAMMYLGLDLFDPETYMRLVPISLLIPAIFTQNKIYHAFVALFSLIGVIAFCIFFTY